MSAYITNNHPCPICLDEMNASEYKKTEDRIGEKKAALLEGREIEKGDHSKKSSLKGLECGHIFDRTCIKEWFKQSEACPMYRRIVSPKEDRPNHSINDSVANEAQAILDGHIILARVNNVSNNHERVTQTAQTITLAALSMPLIITPLIIFSIGSETVRQLTNRNNEIRNFDNDDDPKSSISYSTK